MSGLLAITWASGCRVNMGFCIPPLSPFCSARPENCTMHTTGQQNFGTFVYSWTYLCGFVYYCARICLWIPPISHYGRQNHKIGHPSTIQECCECSGQCCTMYVIQLKNCLGFIFLMTELWTSNQTYWECKCKLFSKKEECFPGCPTCSDGADVSFPPWGQKFHHKTRRVESCWLLCVKSWSNNSAYLARYTVFIFF